MAIQIACPHCGAACLVAEQHLGGRVRCFACARVFTPAKTAPATQLDDEFPLPTFDAVPQRPRAAATPHLDIAAATTPGQVRAANEDRCLVRRHVWSRGDALEELALLCIADGMGGHGGGDRASAMTVQSIHKSV